MSISRKCELFYHSSLHNLVILCYAVLTFCLAECRCKSDNATLPEFEEVLKAMEMLSLVPLAPRIFDLFDNNRDGTVDMREIIAGFSSLKYSQGDDALRLCFQVRGITFSIHV